MTVDTCTLTGNSALNAGSGGGGAIYNKGDLKVTAATISGNLADQGGGIDNVGTGSLTIFNTIVAGNTLPLLNGIGPDMSGTILDAVFDLIGNGGGETGAKNGTNSNLVGNSTVPINPLLGPLRQQRRTNETMLPQSGGNAALAPRAVTRLAKPANPNDATIYVTDAAAIASSALTWGIVIDGEHLSVTSVNLTNNSLTVGHVTNMHRCPRGSTSHTTARRRLPTPRPSAQCSPRPRPGGLDQHQHPGRRRLRSAHDHITITAKDAANQGAAGPITLASSNGTAVSPGHRLAGQRHRDICSFRCSTRAPARKRATRRCRSRPRPARSREPAATSLTPDKYSENLPDTVIQNLVRTDCLTNGSLTWSNWLALFSQAETENPTTVSAAEMTSFKYLVANPAAFSTLLSVNTLAYKVIDGDPANTTYNFLNAQGARADRVAGQPGERQQDLRAGQISSTSGSSASTIPPTPSAPARTAAARRRRPPTRSPP